MIFAIANESTDPEITAELLQKIADALVKQTATDFAGMWESQAAQVVLASLDALPPGASVLHVVDDIPEAPSALAYHTVDATGRPVLRLGWLTIKGAGGTLMTGSVTLSSAMSHEVLETLGDPYVSFWADFDGFREVALEVCDPVEGDAYDIDGVSVSNFVGPRWFDAGGLGPFDFLGKLSAPLTMSPGGYMVLREGGPGGTSSQVLGDARTAPKAYGRRA